jgi:hypothetical protein
MSKLLRVPFAALPPLAGLTLAGLVACTARSELNEAALSVDSGLEDSGVSGGGVFVGVDLDLRWDSPVSYLLEAYVTFARRPVGLNPGGTELESEELEGCRLRSLDPSTSHHLRVDRIPTLDVGPAVQLEGEAEILTIPREEVEGRTYYILSATSELLEASFPAAFDLAVDSESPSVPSFHLPLAALFPQALSWSAPAELLDIHASPYPVLEPSQPLELLWQPAAAPDEDEGVTIWLNVTAESAGAEVWQQLDCQVEDSGRFVLTEALMNALEPGEQGSHRTLALTRHWSARHGVDELPVWVDVHIEHKRWGSYDTE